MDVARRLLICAIGTCIAASPAMAQTAPASGSASPQSCESCHGPGGDSKVASTPRLNGQQAGYIAARLKALAAEASSLHAQTGMLKELAGQSEADRLSIAKYFAAQKPTNAKPGPRAAEGKLIFEQGAAADNVIGCAQCHGADGAGHETTPRIAGQHAEYLKGQIRLFSMKFRDHVLMHPNTKTMSANTVDALMAYLAND